MSQNETTLTPSAATAAPLEANNAGRPKIPREKIWNMLSSVQCYYCDAIQPSDNEACTKCGKKRLEAMTPSKTAKELKRSISSVYRAKTEMPVNYKAAYSEMPDKLEDTFSMKRWIENIRLSGHVKQLGHVPMIKNILNGKVISEFKCHPDRFDLEKSRQFVLAYQKEKNVEKVPYHVRMAVRHFLMSKGINIPRGMGDAYGLSGEKQNYGEYSHILLKDEEIEKARTYIKEHFDLDTLLFFDWGIESCARSETIVTTEISKMNLDSAVKTIRVYESKTEKTWTKYLLADKYPHAKETLDEIQKYMVEHNGRKYLFTDTTTQYAVDQCEKVMRERLKEVYKSLGKTDDYFYMRPVHSLRHIGAHLWLRRTNYDYGLVAEIGGWEGMETLKDCYGAMTGEVILDKLNSLKF